MGQMNRPGAVKFFAKVFGWMNFVGVTIQCLFPCAPPCKSALISLNHTTERSTLWYRVRTIVRHGSSRLHDERFSWRLGSDRRPLWRQWLHQYFHQLAYAIWRFPFIACGMLDDRRASVESLFPALSRDLCRLRLVAILVDHVSHSPLPH